MALIIEGMEIPADCCDCQVRDHEYGECQILGRRTYGVPPRDCPIKGEIPDKHGNLKDEQTILNEMELRFGKVHSLGYVSDIVQDMESVIMAVPTVVESEE